MKKINVYLSGPILGCPKYLYKTWRENTKNELHPYKKYNFLDPTILSEIYSNEAEHADEVVNAAKVGVENCDILFVYIPFYSMGTSFEIFWAHQLNKKIIIALEAEYESAFARKFADFIFYSLQDAINFLKSDTIFEEFNI